MSLCKKRGLAGLYLALLIFFNPIHADEIGYAAVEVSSVDEAKGAVADDQTYIEATLIGRYMSNQSFFKNSPYAFVLFDTEYGQDEWKISGGVFGQKGLPHPDFPINHLYVDYFGEDTHLRIGKMVAKVGVLDYFSTLDTLNPIRFEFFDDPKMNIKRVPVWMVQADYSPIDELKFSLFLQPYDSKYQDYSGYYVNYALNRFIPQHYHEFFQQNPIGQDIFAPVYYNAISPFIAHEIDSKTPSQPWSVRNTSFGLGTEYTDARGKFGFLYFNRYSEIPLIRVDQNLLDAAILYDNGGDISPALNEYLASMDLDPIKSVQGFRYQQAGIYSETTMDSYGIRAEAAFRDKVPLLNTYGSISSFGFAIDHISDSSTYYALEAQYLHLSKYNKNAMIGMFTTKFEPISFSVFRGHFENRIIAAAVDNMADVGINPSFSIEYDHTDLVLQGIVSENNSESNSISILLRSTF
ncbi:DUF1302 family protein [Sulfuricurvum sp.]|uniref:DUF1302 family protein n=1 Tax=Sulfuricurvum sp. TaxID=2025608 RepID=UPI002D538A5B|nr:DUF1302 family protein [Sulfuricurvum sp.]HZF69287.1 DUF1302 family protein [Sulfuricurvum sp.]